MEMTQDPNSPDEVTMFNENVSETTNKTVSGVFSVSHYNKYRLIHSQYNRNCNFDFPTFFVLFC